MKAIPTRYKGVQFRSRLEARWAAMFDLLEWRWEYEPIDLEGYIPDFVLMFPAGRVLVEIKPAFTVAELLQQAAAKVDSTTWMSGNRNNAVIFGATCAPTDEWSSEAACALRQLYETDSGSNYPGTWDAGEWFTCRDCGRPSLLHSVQSYVCTVCGAYDGDHHISGAPNIRALWAEAGNAVQWKSPR
jgi:ribosomal protein L37E